MFCPQCGQQQVPGVVRFCSRCGFSLDGVMQLLSNGGMLPVFRDPDTPQEMSPRKRGVRQGGMLFLLGVIIVPILGLFASYVNGAFPEILTGLAALICFLGGPLRMLFAALFEEPAPRPVFPTARPFGAPPMAAPQFSPPRRNQALPPPPAQSGLSWRGRPNTAELVNPPSVTENTTRLLNKEDRSGDQ
ncbi:MAG TPA: hypothetical protein VI306_06150 [Pyrinomonadaceae bacterium]